MKQLIDNKDYKGIEEALAAHPNLANEGIPFDEANPTKAHPLHRICDGVFAGQYNEEEALKMAKLFLAHGADVNGGELIEKKDTPLVAASSLHADELALFYIANGANIQHAGCSGGTALHWAAWCGRPKVVEKLIEAGAPINKKCIDFEATPLFWAIHGLKNGGTDSLKDTSECVSLLLRAGADQTIPNINGYTVFDMLYESDTALRGLLKESE